MMEEIFKPICGFAGYEIGNLGTVRSLPKQWITGIHGGTIKSHNGQVLKPGLTTKGYYSVNLWKDGKMKRCSIHRMVATHFIPNPTNLPEVNHIDANKTNAAHWNLEWTTRQGNIDHSVANNLIKRGERKTRLNDSDIVWIRNLYATGETNYVELSHLFHVNTDTIGYIVTRKRWKQVV